MRIAVNCRSILKPQRTGIGRYTRHLIGALARLDHANDYFLYAPRGIFDFKRITPRSSAANFKVRRDYFALGPEKVCGPLDIYHLPSPDFTGTLRCKVVVTVHDLIDKAYPQSHTPQTIDLSDRKMKDVVGRADRIICCSQTTRDDLHRFFQVDTARTCVIYQGVDRTVFFPLAPDEKGYAADVLKGLGVGQPFILFVGTIEPRKNLSNLLEAFAALKSGRKFTGPLVIVGMKGWMTGPLADALNRKGLGEEVVFLGYVTDEQLRVLYHQTEAFVFPSLYEGFGFPIVEAFACGAAVVASNTSSCAEVAGDAALTVAPQPQEIAAAIARVIQDPSLKASLKAKGLKRADQFSFDTTARRTLEVYQEAAHVH